MGTSHSSSKKQCSESSSNHSTKGNKNEKKEKKQHPSEAKLLLLGAGESGKSTILKQIRIIRGPGYSKTECLMYRHVVVKNVIQSLMTIINAMTPLEVQFARDDIIAIAREFLDAADATVHRGALSQEMGNLMKALWEDPGLQRCFARSREYQLNDSAAYFLNALDRISRPGYIPTLEDVLRTRISTNGCEEQRYSSKGLNIKVVTFGGYISKEELRQSFNDVTAILFCVALSAYDLVLEEEDLIEGDDVNRLKETLKMFDVICNSQWFLRTPVVILFNKKDIFAEKITKSPLTICFPDYIGANTYEEASEYIQMKFKNILKLDDDRKLFCFTTCATDGSSIAEVLNSISDIIVNTNVKANLVC